MHCLRVRYLIFLALVYLVLVFLLYHYLWQAHTLDNLFEVPGGVAEARRKHTDVYNDDYPAEVGDPGKVEFNFRRNPAPHGVKIFDGQWRHTNSSRRETDQTHTSVLSINSSSSVKSVSPSTTLSKESLQTRMTTDTGLNNVTLPKPNPCLHAFYYAWYGNVETDGRYMHWNHHYMSHWNPSVSKKYPQGRHVPPEDIGASFYPELGCYSSIDPGVITQHMLQLRSAGVGVISVSWYPPGLSDDEGPPPDPVIPVLLDASLAHGIKITLHIEPYKGRTPQSVRDDLLYIHSHYTQHPAYYKQEHVNSSENGEKHLLPVIYIYDSYLSPASEWATVFRPDGALSVRGREYDCVAIALLVEHGHMQFAVDGGFDGVYTYFAANGFSFGSTFSNWDTISKFADRNGLLFIPSFGPGYNDLQVRPWNKVTSLDREHGTYYQEGFKNALKHSRGGIISITSFNEWGEGTQIEPAVPQKTTRRTYLDYSPRESDFYLQLTRKMSEQLARYCGIT